VPVIDIRTYQLHPGAAERFHQTMQTQSLPLLRAAGTDVLAGGASLEDPCAYLLVRAYPNRAAREASQLAFYASDAWRRGPRETILACIDNYHSVVVEADAALVAAMRRLAA
jgi:hypothetical protein